MEKALHRAPECELVVQQKKSYQKMWKPSIHVSCKLHSVYVLLKSVIIQVLTPVSVGPMLRAEQGQDLQQERAAPGRARSVLIPRSCGSSPGSARPGVGA